jgi:hypothetical protein
VTKRAARSYRRTGATPRAGGRVRHRGSLAGAIGALVAIAVIVIVVVTRRHPPPAPPADGTATMEPQQALERGIQIAQGGAYTQSLPYFRRALDAGGWNVHWNYAAVLNNASIELRRPFGLVVPASRSAIERVALVREALDEVAAAERQVPDARARARLRVVRGRTLELWGFPVEALGAYREALAMDPTCEPARSVEAAIIASLRDAGGPAPWTSSSP